MIMLLLWPFQTHFLIIQPRKFDLLSNPVTAEKLMIQFRGETEYSAASCISACVTPKKLVIMLT